MIDLIETVAEPLVDAFRRPITYLRVSVTDRCNLRCVYCMPEEGLAWIDKHDILTFEEIERVVRAAASVGVRSIRITGGEPLVRRNIVDLVARIAAVPGIACSIPTSRATSRRTSGSPPEMRTLRTPTDAAARTIAAISSYERISARGIQGSPSSGMQ